MLTPDGARILRAIRNPPEEEREEFDLERVQRLALTEAAEVLGVSVA
jgi:RNA polymerase sigma-70 factor (ECF subfamily)